MIYSSIDYFIENFGSQIPEDKIQYALKKASIEMDKYLIHKPRTIDEMSEYEVEIFNYTCCELAIYLYKNGKYIDSSVSSLSIADTSYTFNKENAKSKIQEILISLNDTRFMNRQI